MRGQSADRRWCGTPHPWRASRSRLSPDRRRRPAHDAGRARLSALCCGVFLTAPGRAFRDWWAPLGPRSSCLSGQDVRRNLRKADQPPSASSWQGDVALGRSPDAARVRAVRSAHPRAPPQSEARNCRAPAAGRRDLFSGPAYPACSATKTPLDDAPQASRVKNPKQRTTWLSRTKREQNLAQLEIVPQREAGEKDGTAPRRSIAPTRAAGSTGRGSTRRAAGWTSRAAHRSAGRRRVDLSPQAGRGRGRESGAHP
jgi:hypothetical protein